MWKFCGKIQLKEVPYEAGICDLMHCGRKATYAVYGKPWGVPLVCSRHAVEERRYGMEVVKMGEEDASNANI